MKERKPRFSKQRHAIYQYLLSTTSHPTAEEVYHAVQGDIPDISLGTVYRNLNVLVEQNLVRRLDIGMSAHFDADMSAHYHLVCKTCGVIDDLFLDASYALPFIDVVQEQSNFQIDSAEVTFHGTCEHCQLKN